MQALQQNPEVTNTQVVTKALFNVKQQLNLSNHVIGEIIGADAATVSRMQKNMDMKHNKVFEATVLLIRIYRSLFAILGGSSEAMQHWLNEENLDFKHTSPLEQMKSIVGLVHTVEYLDAMRGRT